MIFVGLLAAATMLPGVGKADDTPQCSPPAAVTQIPIPNLPHAILETLRAQLGVIAEPGKRFDKTDVVLTHVNRRFIFAWTLRGSWVVATEHGGLGYNDPIIRFDPDAKGTLTFTALRIAVPETVCREASALLNGARP